jgi:hypothetical protein
VSEPRATAGAGGGIDDEDDEEMDDDMEREYIRPSGLYFPACCSRFI